MLKKMWIILGIVILIIASTTFFYLQKDKSQIEGEIIQLEDIPTEPEELPLIPDPISDIKQFQIIAKRFEFIPETIQVNQGDSVKIVLTTEDVTHGFSIAEYKISERIEPGEEQIIEFIADKKGEFQIICNVPCGSGHSDMRGTLIVN